MWSVAKSSAQKNRQATQSWEQNCVIFITKLHQWEQISQVQMNYEEVFRCLLVFLIKLRLWRGLEPTHPWCIFMLQNKVVTDAQQLCISLKTIQLSRKRNTKVHWSCFENDIRHSWVLLHASFGSAISSGLCRMSPLVTNKQPVWRQTGL